MNRITDLHLTPEELTPLTVTEMRARYAAARARIHGGTPPRPDTTLPPVPKHVRVVLTDLKPGEVLLSTGLDEQRAPTVRRLVATAAVVFCVEQRHLVSPLAIAHLTCARRVTAHVGVRICHRPAVEVGRGLGSRTADLVEAWALHVEREAQEGVANVLEMVQGLRTALGV